MVEYEDSATLESAGTVNVYSVGEIVSVVAESNQVYACRNGGSEGSCDTIQCNLCTNTIGGIWTSVSSASTWTSVLIISVVSKRY